jgi:ADP-heptose:LPS heptosyltransferase
LVSQTRQTKKKILLIRLDKIGDLVCTMCVDQIAALKDYDTEWVIAKGLAFVPEHALPRRSFTEFKKENNKDSRSLEHFLNFLDEQKPDIAVSFQAPWWVNYALWKKRVPVRAGVRSQWHSYLFLNKGLRQKRSEAIKHESDYNRELLEFALGAAPQTPSPILKLKARENPDLLRRHGLSAKNYVVVHPGMAGSALNWPIHHYIEYIEKLIAHESVVLTGMPADEKWLKDIQLRFDKEPRVICLQNLLNNSEMLTVLENAKWVVAPSTGMAHLAASLGTAVVGIYSPVRVQHPRRWAARGENVFILVPDVPCPARFQCLGEKCGYYNCMEKITPEQVLKL